MTTEFSQNLKQLRLGHHYSMQQLADLANVSKSMISKIERDEVQPTLDIATRLAQAFGRSLSSMLETQAISEITLIRSHEQPLWEDPITHFKRRVLSPTFQDSKLEWLEVIMPKGIKLELSPLKKGSEKYVLLIEGLINLQVGSQEIVLGPGDSAFFDAHVSHIFNNAHSQDSRYYLIIKHA